ncbi:MAG: hypothetical protein G01um101470_1115 [Parcubacteria group bacterium Gr01-1014_70]|nr:MAG: hypothetical protein G01um101470_1115 [Parcubacteria group bacterium Gr01-1014_70]
MREVIGLIFFLLCMSVPVAGYAHYSHHRYYHNYHSYSYPSYAYPYRY